MSGELVVTKRRGLAWYVGWSLFGVVVLVLVYWFGRQSSAQERELLQEERDVLLNQVDEYELRIADLEQQTIILQSSAQVDATASEQIMETITTLQQNIDALETELSFYRGIMAPELDVRGLQVSDLKLTPTSNAETINFRLVLTQVKTHKNFIRGNVSIVLEGERGGDQQSYSLTDISDVTKQDLTFGFRYFQNLRGEFRLPDDFAPKRVVVTANSDGRNAQTAEKEFSWSLTR